MEVKNTPQCGTNRFWDLVHNVIAHPLLGIFRAAPWSVRFHDWTADKAYFPYTITDMVEFDTEEEDLK